MRMTTWGAFSVSGLRQYLRLYRRIQRIAAGERVSCCHCATLLPEGWIAWMLKKQRRLPYMTYVHGEELGVGQTSRQLRWMMRRVLAGADGIIANSQNTRRLLVAEWQQPNDKLHVMNPGVDAKRFRPSARDMSVRQDLGWEDRPVVLTAGRLQERKGHSQLIRAMQTVRQAIPGVLYSIVGDGEERPKLQRLVAELGLEAEVQFVGNVNDDKLVSCYQQCDLFVLPNREVAGDFEGFGMVLVEAQSCGKPVIAGRSGGTSETLIAGETGLLIDCSDTERLAKETVSLLSRPEQLARMGDAARAWAAATFDWDSLAKAAEVIFESVSSCRQTGPRPGLSAPTA